MRCDSEGGYGKRLAWRSDVRIHPTAHRLCTCQTAFPTPLLLIALPDHPEWRSLLRQSVLSFAPHADASENPSGDASVRVDRDGSLGSTARDGFVRDADARTTVLCPSSHASFLFPFTSRARVSFGCVWKEGWTLGSERGCPARGPHRASCVCCCALRTLR